ncbi:MAG: tetratricopeptide repeat protein [Betaproteobacteria bacterium]
MSNRKKKSKQGAIAVSMERRSGSALIIVVILFTLIVGMLAAAAHTRNGIYRSHVTLWDNVTKRSPNKRRAHENYGQALSTAGSVAGTQSEARKLYYEALKQFQTVMSLKDDGSVPLRDLYREIGVVYFRLAQYDDAISAWETGLRYAPYDPSLLNNLSIVFMQKGRFDEAASVAAAALSVNPYMPQALNTMGQVAMVKNDYEKAVQYFLKAIEREPDMPARYWNAALALERAKKYDLALQYANRYVAMESNPAAGQRAREFIEYLRKRTGGP